MSQTTDSTLEAKKAEDQDSGISMVDILEEEERLEADANAVLGDSDDKNCTYPQGYINRQALYACRSCSTLESSPAGVCLACSYECHEGHELYELYTKRYFRCDCGNNRFPNMKCKLFPEKEDTNMQNKYNQNFTGVYCTCKRPYPDPDDDVEDEMIQCVVCEDWFHGRHLGVTSPHHESYQEMACTACMKKYDFLWLYTDQGSVSVVTKEETAEVTCDTTIDVLSDTADKPQDTSLNNSKQESPTQASSEEEHEEKPVVGKSEQHPSEVNQTDGPCLIKGKAIGRKDCAAFWLPGWRTTLCKCQSCMKMYNDFELNFLIDEKDTVHAYEERGREKHEPVSQQAKEIRALSQMNRIQQVEVLQGFNDLKSELSDYLKKFAENGKVVREEDIHEFFGQLQARKKQRVTPPMQYFCK